MVRVKATEIVENGKTKTKYMLNTRKIYSAKNYNSSVTIKFFIIHYCTKVYCTKIPGFYRVKTFHEIISFFVLIIVYFKMHFFSIYFLKNSL